MIFLSCIRPLGLAAALALSLVGPAQAQEPGATQESPAEFELGVQAFQAGQMADALRLWNGLLETHPLRPELLNNLAVLYSRSGDRKKAGQLLAQAAATPPYYASIVQNLQRFKAPGDTPPDLTLIPGWPRPGMTVSQLGPALERRPSQRISSLMESVKRAEQHRLGLNDELLVGVVLPPPPGDATPASQRKRQAGPPASLVVIQADLEEALAQWKASWQERDVAAYLGWYAPDFTPAAGLSRADWQKQRQSRLTDAKQIELAVRVTRTEPGPLPDSQWLHTVQRYKSAVFQDVSSKSMLWVRTPDGWRILRELSGPPDKRG